MRRRSLPLVSAPLAALVALPVGALPADAAAPAQASGTAVAASHASTGSTSAAERRRKAARQARPAAATTSMVGLNNAVRVVWRAAPRANRYRVKWAYAPWDKWPRATRYSPWLSASSRSRTLAVSTNAARDTTMTALPYANPVFARVQTAYGSRLGPWSRWRAAWPRVPRPRAGYGVRLGTYNVMLAGRVNWARRMPRIARNIAAHGLTVVALQETLSTNSSGIASRLTRLTGHTWKVAYTGRSEGRILYDSRRFTLRRSGILNRYSPKGQAIHSYRTGRTIMTPFARLRPVGSSRTFTVVSIHFAPSNVRSGPSAATNKQTGASARAVLAALNRMTGSKGLAVIAGDFAGGYARWGDRNPAQPTLVRSGWWDAMASMTKLGYRYSTVNGRRGQRATAAVAGRADGIFLRGIRGTTRYMNVANYFMPGSRVPPSDHNLVFSDFQIPGA